MKRNRYVNRFEVRQKRRVLELQGSYFVQPLSTDNGFMLDLVWQTSVFVIILLFCIKHSINFLCCKNLNLTIDLADVSLIPSILAAAFLILYDLFPSVWFRQFVLFLIRPVSFLFRAQISADFVKMRKEYSSCFI